MALATQCPHCKTPFRVAHDQLKLRAGLVRCGSCKQIFNGIENLLRPAVQEKAGAPALADDATLIIAPETSALDQPSALDASLKTSAPDEHSEAPYSAPVSASPQETVSLELQDATAIVDTGQVTEPSTAAKQVQDDPMLRMTLLDVSALHKERDAKTDKAVSHVPAAPMDPLDQVIEELRNRPLRQDGHEDDDKTEPEVESETDLADGDVSQDIPDQSEEDEPGFVRQARRRQRWQRASRFLLATASLLLFLAALAQSAYLFRDDIAARYPEIRPLLSEACAQINCEIRLPAQIDRVSIESDQLVASATESDTFVLSLVLRNRSAVPQAWPNIELTLNDNEGTAILRKVFTPNDYVVAAEIDRGFTASAEQVAQLRFSLSQLKAAGYRVYLFYP